MKPDFIAFMGLLISISKETSQKKFSYSFLAENVYYGGGGVDHNLLKNI